LVLKFNEAVKAGEEDAPAAESGEAPDVTAKSIQNQGLSGNTSYSTNEAPGASPSASSEGYNSMVADASDAGDSANKSSNSASQSIANQEVAGLFSIPLSPLVWVSPDQKLKAVAGEQRVSVYSTDDNTLLFQSAIHNDESLSNVYWEQDSSVLYYSWMNKDGVATDMLWTAVTNSESVPSKLEK
jgi:hypothetical protein